MNSRPGLLFEIIRLTALATALWLAPAYAVNTDAVPLSSAEIEPASRVAAAGFEGNSRLHDCVVQVASDHSHCCQSLRDVQLAGPAPVRDDREPAPLAHPFAVIPREIPADKPIASARSLAPTFPRFILFGNYRS